MNLFIVILALMFLFIVFNFRKAAGIFRELRSE
jgi:hypothetical protein